MARFAAAANGDILQFTSTWQSEKSGPGSQLPPNATYVLHFDETTNAGLIAAYNANSNQFRMNGGTLTQNDVEATINPPSFFYQAFLDRVALMSKAQETSDPFTREEIAKILAVAFRIAGLD